MLGLGFYLLSAAGLVLLLRARAPDRPKVLWLDGLVAALTLASLAAFVVIEPTAADGGGTLSTLAAYPVHPSADLVLLGVVAGGMALLGWRPDRAWATIGAAFLIQVAVDWAHLYQAAEGTYARGALLGSGWLAAACLVGYAAWRDPGPPRVGRGEAATTLVVPLVFAFVALGVMVYGSLDRVHGRENAAAMLLAGAALLVSLIRSGLNLAEQRRLRAAAFEDSLSGLMNYSGFHNVIENEIERAQRSGQRFCVVTFELDGLKRLNDLRGHQEGDRMLRRLANTIRTSHRAADVPARIAGAVFAVVLPGTSGVRAQAAAGRVQSLIAALDEPVGVSVGIAEWPTDGPSKERLLRRADIALQASKQSGAQQSDTALPARADGTGEPE